MYSGRALHSQLPRTAYKRFYERFDVTTGEFYEESNRAAGQKRTVEKGRGPGRLPTVSVAEVTGWKALPKIVFGSQRTCSLPQLDPTQCTPHANKECRSVCGRTSRRSLELRTSNEAAKKLKISIPASNEWHRKARERDAEGWEELKKLLLARTGSPKLL